MGNDDAFEFGPPNPVPEPQSPQKPFYPLEISEKKSEDPCPECGRKSWFDGKRCEYCGYIMLFSTEEE